MIINNNNNNNGYDPNCGCHCCNQQQKTETAETKPEYADLLSQPLKYDRATMVKLSKYMGWSGYHFFHFKRPFLGVCHLIMSLVGIAGAVSILYLFIFCHPENLVLFLTFAFAAIIPLLLSAFLGIMCSVYWASKTDEDFKKTFPISDEKK